MDRRINPFENRDTAVFNSALEVGLRVIFILNEFSPKSLDLNKLITFDYLIIHSGDVEGGPASIHPPLPHRASQILVKREVMKNALILMQSKELLKTVFLPSGIEYRATELTSLFVKKLDSTYAEQLRKSSNWLKSRFATMNEEALESYVKNNIENWGGEFIMESLFRGGQYE